ncbi:MAG: single-stranded-DNA-specific exonuclease RecJ [bacterium]|nr:single-stranded-DNA-specific exonuclease RecJ [bacterium]
MQSKWEVTKAANPSLVHAITEQINLPEIVAEILINRGIDTPQAAKLFFNGATADLCDPFLITDMEIAVERVVAALGKQEKIIIHGDYDVDGITAVSMLYLFLRDLGGKVSYYIPDRQQEGYGLSMGGIEESRRRGASLIISVDCGITSVTEVELARKLGIDTIISDHHEPGQTLPAANAVLDPKRNDCRYPFKELAGVGVAYKLAQGILKRMNLEQVYLERYLDLVAIGSAADIVPLISENRILVKEGLERLNHNGNEGLKALIDIASFKRGDIHVGNIVFGLAPRINAVGRLGSAERAVRLLITRDYQQALTIAAELERENRRRKEIDNQTLLEALDKISREYVPENDYVIVLARENWHPGVIGIVASRIVERYYRPTVMITIEDGIGKGSARSIPGFDLYGAIRDCSDLLEQFGGHKYAAGLTIRADRIAEFKERFNAVAAGVITDDDLIPKLNIDAVINLDEITPVVVKTLREFAPFGPKNMKPNFVTYGLEIVGSPRIVGSNHLKFKVRQPGHSSAVYDAIGYNLGHLLPITENNRAIDMVYTVEENEWMNQVNLQLSAKDLR